MILNYIIHFMYVYTCSQKYGYNSIILYRMYKLRCICMIYYIFRHDAWHTYVVWCLLMQYCLNTINKENLQKVAQSEWVQSQIKFLVRHLVAKSKNQTLSLFLCKLRSICTDWRLFIYGYIYIYICIHTHIHIYTYAHIYICIYYKYTCIYILFFLRPNEATY